jgi:hypothetical protein
MSVVPISLEFSLTLKTSLLWWNVSLWKRSKFPQGNNTFPCFVKCPFRGSLLKIGVRAKNFQFCFPLKYSSCLRLFHLRLLWMVAVSQASHKQCTVINIQGFVKSNRDLYSVDFIKNKELKCLSHSSDNVTPWTTGVREGPRHQKGCVTVRTTMKAERLSAAPIRLRGRRHREGWVSDCPHLQEGWEIVRGTSKAERSAPPGRFLFAAPEGLRCRHHLESWEIVRGARRAERSAPPGRLSDCPHQQKGWEVGTTGTVER